MNSIDFYFDFISPYAYLAAGRIEKLAARHGRTVNWRPFRLGIAVVKVMGLRPVMETPLKGEYALCDIRRLAAVLSEPLVYAGALPNPLPPARVFYSAPDELAPTLALALLQAQWARGEDIGSSEVLRQVVASIGLDPDMVDAALATPVSLASLRNATDQALQRGVFGSPTFAVGEAKFWGLDRLWLLDAYLESGERYLPLQMQRAEAMSLA